MWRVVESEQGGELTKQVFWRHVLTLHSLLRRRVAENFLRDDTSPDKAEQRREPHEGVGYRRLRPCSDTRQLALIVAQLAAVHAKLPGMITTLATPALAAKTTTDEHYASRASFDSVYGRFRRVVRAAGGDALVRALLPEFISRDPKEYEEDTSDSPSEVVSDMDSDVGDSGGGDSGGA